MGLVYGWLGNGSSAATRLGGWPHHRWKQRSSFRGIRFIQLANAGSLSPYSPLLTHFASSAMSVKCRDKANREVGQLDLALHFDQNIAALFGVDGELQAPGVSLRADPALLPTTAVASDDECSAESVNETRVSPKKTWEKRLREEIKRLRDEVHELSREACQQKVAASSGCDLAGLKVHLQGNTVPPHTNENTRAKSIGMAVPPVQGVQIRVIFHTVVRKHVESDRVVFILSKLVQTIGTAFDVAFEETKCMVLTHGKTSETGPTTVVHTQCQSVARETFLDNPNQLQPTSSWQVCPQLPGGLEHGKSRFLTLILE
ncbi:unnamed protein product [Phytophthora lilii]|uniref:Unnamed protein product n=1 Tax=Phytophthora lilii TaxID=2077276 RepID=A0A9W6WMG8_9STRA|nr:unnamed protein product [Phytophthora lilii]